MHNFIQPEQETQQQMSEQDSHSSGVMTAPVQRVAGGSDDGGDSRGNNSSQVRQLQQLQSGANSSPRVMQLMQMQSAVNAGSQAVLQRIPLADAKDAIEDAAGGWGTDEDGIYQAIRDCDAADRPALAADPDVQRILRDEMEGHDLWKALLLLEYGNESAFPDAINEIWGATQGWGTDEQRIFDALAALSVADVQIIANVPGLQDMLDDELSGADLGAANDYLSGDYARAIQDHKDDVTFAQTELGNMRTSGVTEEENTAEWLDPQVAGASPRTDLHLLTSTHDSAARATEHGQDADYRAYFGKDELFPDNTGDYDANISSERNIFYRHRDSGGTNFGSKIYLYDVRTRGAATFKRFLLHEVQHSADRHRDEPEDEMDRDDHGEGAFSSYKTEFRSYWLDNRFGAISDASSAAQAPFDNARQKRIFDLLYGSPLYEYVKAAYDEEKDVNGESFKDLVHAYVRPEGVNLINSPRIDIFFEALERCSKSDTDTTTNPLSDLITAANALDANDQAAMNASEALRLQEQMKDHLETSVLATVATIVNGGAAPAWVNVNISEAREAFEEAGSGWGTDEDRIFDTIRNANAAERSVMKADPVIRRVMYTELEGHDLWRAEILLEFGEEANWPSAITEIFAATDGWGTDEDRIREALERLTRPQVEAIAAVPGLRRILDGELGGTDLQVTNDLLDGQYADAIANYQADITAIDTVLQAGLTSADATWQGLATKLVDPAQCNIYAMTKTHDAVDRAADANQTGKQAFFGADSAYPATTGSYNSKPGNNSGIRFKTLGTQSETAGRMLYIYEARNIAAPDLKSVLETFGNTLP